MGNCCWMLSKKVYVQSVLLNWDIPEKTMRNRKSICYDDSKGIIMTMPDSDKSSYHYWIIYYCTGGWTGKINEVIAQIMAICNVRTSIKMNNLK